MKQSELYQEMAAAAEQSYNQLDGEWRDWLEVARRYEVKVLSQDRLDLRHDIIVELARARARDGKPIPTLRAYRIASLTVALYWRKLNRTSTLVCVLDGTAKRPDLKSCQFQHKPSKCSECPFRASRPLVSLDSELEDNEGNTIALKETVADDNAIDLDQWQDEATFILGCPMRLIEIAHKKRTGTPLNWRDHKYWERQVKKERARYQTTLF